MNPFLEISVILAATCLVAALLQLIRQPLIIAYIIAGILIGPYAFDILHSTETLEIFATLGISLLLFIIGLSLNPFVIKEVGKVSLITGVGQVVFTSVTGFVIARLLGYAPLVALYIAVALTFSSTIIILKLLSDKKELKRLYGKIATGFLLVQDMIAAIALIAITSLAGQANLGGAVIDTLVKLALLVLVFYALTVFVVPRLLPFFARSGELLFLTSITWGFGAAAIAQLIGLSVEIGSLFAGVALATSPYSQEISSKMRPLRDFFIIIFFVLLGATMVLDTTTRVLLPAAVFSLLIVLGNPLIVMALMGRLGYRKETSFKAGLTVAQIGEFSLVLVILGGRVGHLPPEIVSLITIISIFTITLSTYLVIYADALYAFLSPYLGIFERHLTDEKEVKGERWQTVLFGYRGAGINLVESLRDRRQPFLIVDFDPEVIAQLKARGLPALYGDASNADLLESVLSDDTSLIISDVPTFTTNELIINLGHQINNRATIIVTSDSIEEGLELYALGASYVLMPHYLSGAHIHRLLGQNRGQRAAALASQKRIHLTYLRQGHHAKNNAKH